MAVCAEENDTLPYFNCDFYFEPPEVSIHTGTFLKYRSIFILRLWKRFVAKTRVFFSTGMTKNPNNFCLFVCLSFPFPLRCCQLAQPLRPSLLPQFAPLNDLKLSTRTATTLHAFILNGKLTKSIPRRQNDWQEITIRILLQKNIQFYRS